MIKDRFGGLFSPLNKRDIQILTDFERFLQLAQSSEFDEDYEYKLGDPRVPGAASFFDVDTPGSWVGWPLWSIYNYFKELYDELKSQCDYQYKSGETAFYDRQGWTDRLIDTKRQCRVWLSKIAPILKKIKSAQYKLENEELR